MGVDDLDQRFPEPQPKWLVALAVALMAFAPVVAIFALGALVGYWLA